MTNHSKRKRFGILVAGALIGSVLSIGTATGNVSASSKRIPGETTTVEPGPTVQSFFSGIRW